jgi:nicotinamidase-related amidase
MGQVLLVVDMQVGAFDGVRAAPIADGAALRARIRALRDAARAAGVPVVTVQDNGRVGGAYEPGTAHWRLHPDLEPAPGEVVVQKRFGSAFRETDLRRVLTALGADTIVVTGQQSDACVLATVTDALALGFSVVVPADGHGAPDTVAAPAARLVARSNEGFAAAGARVVPAAAITEAWRGGIG